MSRFDDWAEHVELHDRGPDDPRYHLPPGVVMEALRQRHEQETSLEARLERWAEGYTDPTDTTPTLFREAAAEIRRLREQVARLRHDEPERNGGK